MAASAGLYAILDVPVTATFTELKKAYYRRAKACHPDLHHGSAAKEEEFKQLVHAFNILSDPLRRRQYDEQLRFGADLAESGMREGDASADARTDAEAIMDSIADDILEELIVGNHLPIGASLQTLMRDLESTHKFIRFREGKTQLYHGHTVDAFQLIGQAVAESPGNILYRYYLGMACRKMGMEVLARRHFDVCIELGSKRTPPQYLKRIREARRRRKTPSPSIIGRILKALRPPPSPETFKTTEQQMIDEVSRSMTAIVRGHASQRRQQRKLLGNGDERKDEPGA